MDELLTPKQVNQEYSLSRGELLALEAGGNLQPYRTTGGHRRYRRSEIESVRQAGFSAAAGNGKGPAASNQPQYDELGVTGIRQFGGSILEERLTELQGRPGRILKREMRLNDPVIGAVFFGIINAMKQATLSPEPASQAPDDLAASVFIESCLNDLSWSWLEQLDLIYNPLLEQGFAVPEVVYKQRLGPEPPPYTPDPAPSQYDDGLVGWRKFAPRPAESLAEGREWEYDRHGGIQGIHQLPVTGQETGPFFIPIHKLLHFRTTLHPANTPEGLAIHRSMYLPYYYTLNMQEIEAIGVERDLAGIPLVYLGTERSLTGVNSDYELAKDLVVNLRNDDQTGIVIPAPKMGLAGEGEGMLVELLSTGGRRQWDVSKIIERYDKRKALAVLAQFIMLGMEQVGSYALSKHQGDLFIIAVTAFLNSIAGVFNRHAIPKLIRFNAHAFPNLTGLPQLKPSVVGVPDLQTLSEYVNRLVDKAVLTPDPDLERHLRRIADLPAPPPAEVQVQQKGLDPKTERTALMVRRLLLALEPLQNLAAISPEEASQMLAPLVDDLKRGLLRKQDDQGINLVNEVEQSIWDEWERLERNTGEVGYPEARHIFKERWVALYGSALTAAWALGRGDDYDPGLEAPLLDEPLQQAVGYLDNFLDAMATEVEMAADDYELGLAFELNRARAVMYAGGVWATYIQAKIFDQPPSSIWQWVGPKDDNTCFVCLEELAAGPRPLGEISRFPGIDTACLTNCRHDLERVEG